MAPLSPTTRPRRVRRRSALTLAALATLGLGAAGQAFAAPALTVDPASGLNPAGQPVAVSGQGFLPPEVPSGFYVAQTAAVDGVIHYNQADAVWVRTTPAPPGVPGMIQVNPDGSFSTQLEIGATVPRVGGGEAIDCLVNACAVTAWPQHQTPTAANVYTAQPIEFAGVPRLTVDPADNLDPAGQTLRVSGNSFTPPTVPSGFYVAQTAEVDGVIHYNQPDAVWVRSTPGIPGTVLLGADGTFAADLRVSGSVPRVGGGEAIDCLVNTCAVTAWPQHQAPTAANRYVAQPLAFRPAAQPPVEQPPAEQPPVEQPPAEQPPAPPAQPTPPVTPPVTTAPETPAAPVAVRPPTLTPARGPQTVAKNRTAQVGTIVCRTGPCRVTVPTRNVTLRIGGTRHRATVLISRTVWAGRRATVRVRLTSGAVRALRATATGRVSVPVRIQVRAGGTTTTRTLRATVRATAR